jgi:hypothetical protein
MAKGSMGRRIASNVDTMRTGFGQRGGASQQGCTYGMNHTVTIGVTGQSVALRDGDTV